MISRGVILSTLGPCKLHHHDGEEPCPECQRLIASLTAGAAPMLPSYPVPPPMAPFVHQPLQVGTPYYEGLQVYCSG
jgi:hypothetical protein